MKESSSSLADSSARKKKLPHDKVFAVYGEAEKKNAWGALFDVEDPRSKADLPEHLHRQCLSRWMTWLLEK
ncbi:hypothetical protein RIF29_14856 [Crotalaria pallida]|uniref:Uncharacterized protein n=1 Tax=Crotalaria pallida TaxID=3830 RepID=A0AAN9FIW9_CROPI